MATFGPSDRERTADEIIARFINTDLTEGEFRTLIMDSINRVGDNCDILIREKTITLGGDLTGTGTTGTSGFVEDPDMDNPTPQDITLTAEIVMGAVGTNELADNSVTSMKIVDGTIATIDIANNAVDNTKLANNAVRTENIVDLNVTTGKLANDAVTNAKLADDSVQTDQIMDGVVTNTKLADMAVNTEELADNAVTAAKLANNAVDTDAILNANVTTDKLADGAVTAAKLGNNVIAAGSVTHSTSIPSTLSADVPFYSIHLSGGMVTVPSGAFNGQIINITSTAAMTINWGSGAQGIGLAGSARIASGIWRMGIGWYFSETVV